MSTELRPLRQIAVHVEEIEPRQFEWVLTERDEGDVWLEFDRARKSVKSFHKAMADGLVAMEQLVEDLDAGPRRGNKEEPMRKPRNKEKVDSNVQVDEPVIEPKKRATLFGFGPVR